MKKLGLHVLTWACMLLILLAWVQADGRVVLVLLAGLAGWLLFSRHGRQAAMVTGAGLRTLPRRWGASLVVVIGIAGVVGVLVALFAMAAGFGSTLARSGSDDTAIVLRGGSGAELSSALSHGDVDVIAAAPGIARDASGKPLLSAEVVVVANVPKRSDPATEANVQIRGVGEAAWKVYPHIRIVRGRSFRPGLRELVVGRDAARQFVGLEVGHTLRLAGEPWSIVGEFAADNAHASELWGAAGSVASAYRRGASVQSVTVRLKNAAGFAAFKSTLETDPRLRVDVQTTRSYYAGQSERVVKTLRIVGTLIGVIMAIGAIFGALNTMYAAVKKRTRDIATLRAIGFRGLPVVVAVLLECLSLALLGGLIGGLLAWWIFDGYTASTLGSNFSQVVFQFKVTPALLWVGLKWALAVGFVGGLFPALRAARLPVHVALRKG